MNIPLTDALITINDITELNGTIIKAKDRLKIRLNKEDIADIIEVIVSIGIYRFVGNTLIDTLAALIILEKNERKTLQNIIGKYLDNVEEREKQRAKNTNSVITESYTQSTLRAYEFYLENSEFRPLGNLDNFKSLEHISYKKLRNKIVKLNDKEKIKEQYRKLSALDNKELAGLFIILDI